MGTWEVSTGISNPCSLHTELPILLMNVMSLSDCQPGMVAEEDPDMEEELAEPDTGESPCAGDMTWQAGGSSFQS